MFIHLCSYLRVEGVPNINSFLGLSCLSPQFLEYGEVSSLICTVDMRQAGVEEQ